MEKVSFKTIDGVQIVGNYYKSPVEGNDKAVLLLHQFSKDKDMWGDFPEMLVQAGFSVLAIDLRGHGESGGSRDDLVDAINDVLAAKEFLTVQNLTNVSIVGSSIGANLALLSGAWAAKVVVLSPGLAYKGIVVENNLPEPVGEALVIVSEEDAQSFASVPYLNQALGGQGKIQIEHDLGHGIAMLNAKPELKQQIINFMLQSAL